MRWYDKEPTSVLTRWVHHRWFRSWNTVDEIGGGSSWLWLTRPLIFNTKGDYEFTYLGIVLCIPFLLVLLNRFIKWLL